MIPYNEWCNYIEGLRKKAIGTTTPQKIAEVFDQSIKKKIPKKRFGILFSGGVDSSLIAFLCNKYGSEFTCYTTGFENSKDIIESTKSAYLLKLNQKKIILDEKSIEYIFVKVASILKDELDVVNLGVGAVVFACLEEAKKDNIEEVFTGLGSEEIFAGYRRHEQSKDINEECWNGLKSMWQRDFKRDFSIAEHFDIKFITPFLDESVIIEAMKAKPEQKISHGEKKYILRQAAYYLGLPEEIAFRKKTAAQYGSSVDKAISKIAKIRGFSKSGYIDYLKLQQKVQ